MRRILLAVLGIVLVLGMITLPPAPVAEAGNNGQQLHFFTRAGTSKITWLYVNRYYYNNSVQTWSLFRKIMAKLGFKQINNLNY